MVVCLCAFRYAKDDGGGQVPFWGGRMGLRCSKTGETRLCLGQRKPAAHEGHRDVSESQEKQDQRKGERQTQTLTLEVHQRCRGQKHR